MKRNGTFLAVGLILGALVSGSIAWATIPSSTDGVITGCYRNGRNDGQLRVIDAEAGAQCKRTETQITWNQQGPTGPAGADGTDGSDGEDGQDGQDGQDGAPGIPGTVVAIPTAALTVTLTDGAWTDLPGVVANFDIAPGTTATVIARYNTVVNPASTAIAFPDIRFVVDGTSMLPELVGGHYYGQLTLERSLSSVAAGTQTVKVQGRLIGCTNCSQQVNAAPGHLAVQAMANP